MNEAQFQEWLAYHFTLYPAFRDWWHTKVEDREVAARAWTDLLQSVDLDEAKEATRRMMNGIEPVVAFGNWSDLPRFVKMHAAKVRKEIVSGRRVDVPVTQRAFNGETSIDPKKMAQLVDDFVEVIASCHFDELDDVKKRILDKMQPLEGPAKPQLTALAAHQLLVLIVKRRTGARDIPHGLSRVGKRGEVVPIQIGHTLRATITKAEPELADKTGILSTMASPESDDEGYDFDA